MLRCTITLAGGTGTCEINGMQFGTHSMYAYFLGGGGWGKSQSPYFIEQVNKNPTTTTMISSLNPAMVNQTITYTATVTQLSDTPTPTGTVTFRDYATVLGQAPLIGNTANFSTSTLAGDTGHIITATYNGDENYNTSASAGLNQVVNKYVSTMAPLTCAPATITSGTATTCSGSITGPATGATINFTSGATGTTVLATTTTGTGGAFSSPVTLSTKGTYGVTATFPGDATWRSAVAAFTEVVH
jgi:hypothetical protein